MSDINWTYVLSDGPNGTVIFTTSNIPDSGSGTLYSVTGVSGNIDGKTISSLLAPGDYQSNTNIINMAYYTTGYIDENNSVAFITLDGTKYAFQRDAGYSDPTDPMYNQDPFFRISWGNFGSWSSAPNAAFSYTAVCYLRGTLILTPHGEVPVEDLKAGDLVATRFGGFKPVRWIGYQRFEGRFVGVQGAPVCFHPGSLGEGVPNRALWVSPGHAVLIDGHLVAASLLVNDVTITQDPTKDTIEYYHIDMPNHDCVLADGAWAETYWENHGNRALFHNAREYYELFPDDHGATRATCLPYVNQGDDPLLPALRSMVTPKLTTDQMSENADLHLLVDGKRVPFQQTGPRTWEAFVGTAARSIEIASRTMRPSMDGRISSEDHRALGVCVYSIELRTSDNVYVIPSDHPVLQRGFHGIERNGNVTWQWTDGRGVIPSVLLDKCLGPVRLVLTASLLASYAAASPTGGEVKSTETLAA